MFLYLPKIKIRITHFIRLIFNKKMYTRPERLSVFSSIIYLLIHLLVLIKRVVAVSGCIIFNYFLKFHFLMRCDYASLKVCTLHTCTEDLLCIEGIMASSSNLCLWLLYFLIALILFRNADFSIVVALLNLSFLRAQNCDMCQ